MKKFLVVALSALLLLALFIPAMAEDGPKFTTTVSANKVKRGDTITVTVSVDKAFDAKTLAVEYSSTCNAAAFEIVESAWTAGLTAKLPIATTDPANFTGVAMGFTPATGISGDILTVTVKAKDDATFGNYAFNVTVKVDSVDAATVGTSVEVYHDCVPATTYSHDAEGHWYACTVPGCTKTVTKTAHGWENACDELCDTCGETRTVTHDYSVQNKDATNHWMECSVCHKVDESTKAAHIESADIPVTPADCANAAVYKKECTVCHLELSRFPVGTPDASLHSGGTATCTSKAVCKYCTQPYGDLAPDNHVGTKKVEKNETEHWEVCQACTKEVAGTRDTHSGGTATCKDKAACTVCSQAYGELAPANHVGTKKVQKNETEHWEVCDSCSKEIAGTRDVHSGGTATCKDKAVCTVCSQAYGAINPENHTGNNAVVPAEPSTCTVLGKKEGVKCVDCGEILSQDPETEFAPHVVSTWTVTDPATETKEGEKKGKCDVCETEFIVKTDKLTATLKPENVVATEGGKIELGETKLPENTVAAIAPEEEANLDEIATEMKTEFDKIPEAAGKELLAVTGVVILLPDTYQDPATGETVVDDSVTDKLPGKVKVTAPVAADLSNYENVVVLVMDAEGKVTKLNATVENGSVVFETDSAVAGVMVLGSAKQAPAPGNNEAQTGDASQVVLFITLALVSVLSLGGIVVSKKARASK